MSRAKPNTGRIMLLSDHFFMRFSPTNSVAQIDSSCRLLTDTLESSSLPPSLKCAIGGRGYLMAPPFAAAGGRFCAPDRHTTHSQFLRGRKRHRIFIKKIPVHWSALVPGRQKWIPPTDRCFVSADCQRIYFSPYRPRRKFRPCNSTKLFC